MALKWIKWILFNFIGVWNIEEIIVYGSENIAFQKPTRQINNSGNRYSSRAVDGNHGLNHYFCTHTQEPNNMPNWWMVDLQAQYEITNVLVLNRGDCCSDRLRNFTISVWQYDPGPHIKHNMAENEYCVCATHPAVAPGGQWTTLPCTKICLGRFILVILNAPEALTLCELEVFGNLFSGCATQYLSEMYVKKIAGKRSSPPNCPPSPHQVSSIHECIHQCLQMINCISFNYSPHLINIDNCQLVTCFSHPLQDFTVDGNWIWQYLSHY